MTPRERRELSALVLVLLVAWAWFMTRLFTTDTRVDTYIEAPAPAPQPVPWDREAHRRKQLATCVTARDELRAQCEVDQTLSSCNRWAEATRICRRWEKLP